jgi:hypothetical protein
LALTKVTLLLAERFPDEWQELFEDDEAADAERRRLGAAATELHAAVGRSLDAAASRLEQQDAGPDVWLDLTRADVALLTSDRLPLIHRLYSDALSRSNMAEGFAAEAAARQIRLYKELGLFGKKIGAALDGLGVKEKPPPSPHPPKARVLVFAGHRIDAADRKTPRFHAPRKPRPRRHASSPTQSPPSRQQLAPAQSKASRAPQAAAT